MTSASTISKTIMRRVYYAYGISVATHPLTVRLVILTLALATLARLVHVAMIYQSLLQTQVGDIGTFLLGMVYRADWLTLVVTFVLIMTVLSFRLPLVRAPHKAVVV